MKININSFSESSWKKHKYFRWFIWVVFLPITLFLGLFIFIGYLSTILYNIINDALHKFYCYMMYWTGCDKNINHFIDKEKEEEIERILQ